MLRIKIVSCLMSIGLLFGGVTNAQLQSSTWSEKIDPRLATKMHDLRPEQTLNVVVKFKIPTARRSAMRLGALDTERKAAVTEGRQALFDSKEFKEASKKTARRNKKRLKLVGSLKYSPYIGMEVTTAEISILARSPRIELIYESAKKATTNLPESTGPSFINATALHGLGHTGSGQTIAILDTGVLSEHNHFGPGKVVQSACFTDDTLCSPNPGEPRLSGNPGPSGEPINSGDTHGTLVAAIAASKDATYKGVAPSANIISARVIGSSSNPSLDTAGALNWVYEFRNAYNIAAVNMSFNFIDSGLFSGSCNSEDPAITDAVNDLNSAGIAVIASSANGGSSNGIGLPACISGVISVGMTGDGSGGASIDQVDPLSNSAANLDLLAPGNEIIGAGEAPASLRTGPGQNIGTSFAAPHVAGAFAVLKSAVPTATRLEILTALKATGEPITDTRNGLIHPRINVYYALDYLQNPPNPPPPPPSTAALVVVPLNGFTLIHTSGQ